MASEATHGDKSAQGARVLVVDDEEVVHVSLKRMLGRMGHEVDAVLGAQEGLERLAAARYDLVITDLMMPEMDGIAFLEQLAARNERTPVLMITGYPTISTALQALRLGAADYVAKPFTRAELLGPVSRALRRGVSEEGEEPPAAPTDRAEAPAVRLATGEVVALPQHAWAAYQQDGTMEVGITASFLQAVGALAAVELPSEAEIVEQGYVAIRLRNDRGEEHGVFMPLSGQVIGVNSEALSAPASIGPQTWLVRLIPNHLPQELSVLVRGAEKTRGTDTTR